MKPTDLYLVAGFLTQERERFCAFLENCEVDPLEGVVIIEDMVKEMNDGDGQQR